MPTTATMPNRKARRVGPSSLRPVARLQPDQSRPAASAARRRWPDRSSPAARRRPPRRRARHPCCRHPATRPARAGPAPRNRSHSPAPRRAPRSILAGATKAWLRKLRITKIRNTALVEAGDQMMRLKPRQPAAVRGMAGRNAEAAHEQQPHRHEQQGADADGGQRIVQRQAAQPAQSAGHARPAKRQKMIQPFANRRAIPIAEIRPRRPAPRASCARRGCPGRSGRPVPAPGWR